VSTIALTIVAAFTGLRMGELLELPHEAVRAGARLRLGRLVTGVRSQGGGHAVATTRGTVRCRWLVNAAGLGGPVEIPEDLRAAALQRAMAFDDRGTVHA